MIIGSRIKEAREAINLSQKDLAEKLGMDPSQFSKIERGKLMPTLLQAIELGKILSKSLDWLVSTVESDQKPEMISGDHYKEQYEWAKQNIELLHTIQELKDKIHLLETENTNLQNKRYSETVSYSMVAEPEPELSKKKK
ncbi:helix-turn-helix transcriptional regulator [Chryseobacterium sp. SNU WT5]|uniref:helix-turn-helix domain-containing protein n=1 Tax=Chryseobacterium sp. SNU WT5 TaxID=2594269 RepID=UPI0011803445|nr:helix-turn-helix domain-containing protein [Chryseobacterium sp. SNU WT5]QDP85229.1 helix-turn-helix transcriptional regulator [Chryseobacterium sp. SNU WT5]